MYVFLKVYLYEIFIYFVIYLLIKMFFILDYNFIFNWKENLVC